MTTAVKRALKLKCSQICSVGMSGGTRKASGHVYIEDKLLLSTVITSVPDFFQLSRFITLHTTLFLRAVSVEKLAALDSAP